MKDFKIESNSSPQPPPLTARGGGEGGGVILASIILITLVAITAHAADYTLLQPLPGIGSGQSTTQVDTFATYLGRLIPFLIALAAVIAMVQIVIGGIQYAISNVPGVETDAKDKITWAILGLLLALTSYLILYTINRDLVNLNLTVPQLPSAGSNTGTGPLVGGPPGSNACINSSQCSSGNCVFFPGTSQGVCQPAGCNDPNGCNVNGGTCGDGTCNTGESPTSCPSDCGGTGTSVCFKISDTDPGRGTIVSGPPCDPNSCNGIIGSCSQLDQYNSGRACIGATNCASLVCINPGPSGRCQ